MTYIPGVLLRMRNQKPSMMAVWPSLQSKLYQVPARIFTFASGMSRFLRSTTWTPVSSPASHAHKKVVAWILETDWFEAPLRDVLKYMDSHRRKKISTVRVPDLRPTTLPIGKVTPKWDSVG